MSRNNKPSTYNNLGCYYGSNNSNTGVFHTPDSKQIGYDTLNHSIVGGNQPYFSFTNAYGKGADSCNTSYTTIVCGSGCGTKENFKKENIDPHSVGPCSRNCKKKFGEFCPDPVCDSKGDCWSNGAYCGDPTNIPPYFDDTKTTENFY